MGQEKNVNHGLKNQLIIENINDVIIILNEKLKIEYINEKNIEKTLGYARGEVINKDALKFIYSDDVISVIEEGRRNWERGEGSMITRFVKKDGNYIWCEFKGKKFIDLDNKEKLLFVLRDITERKKFEENLKESEKKYRLITENANDMIFILNNKFRIEYINERVTKKSLGYSREELIGIDVIKLIHPDDLTKSIEVGRFFWKEGEGATELRIRKNNGKYIWIETKGKGFTDIDGKRKALFISRDISERKKIEQALKESEEKYRLITENANDIIVVFDRNLKFEYINEKPISKTLGYSIDEMSTKNLREFLHPEDLGLAYTVFRKILEIGEGRDEFRIKRKDGTHVWIEILGRTFIDKDKMEKILVIGRDISERKMLEEQRVKYTEHLKKEVETKTKELIQAEKLASIGLLASGVAHEINNPIMGIINYADIIKEDIRTNQHNIDITKKPYSFLDGIVREGNRIAKIVNSLLSLARSDKGEKNKVEISKIIESSLFILDQKIKFSLIDVQLNFQENLPKISINSQQIQQVFTNILQNSIDAVNEKFKDKNRENKKIIINTSYNINENKECIKIIIIDNGIGIESEDQTKLFVPFFTTKQHLGKPGTGLGLSITHKIIREHEGKININSEWNKGTTVEVLLPLKNYDKTNLIAFRKNFLGF